MKVSDGSSGANGVSGEVHRWRMDLPVSYHGSEWSFCDGRIGALSLERRRERFFADGLRAGWRQALRRLPTGWLTAGGFVKDGSR